MTNGLVGNAAFFNGTSSAIHVPWSADFDLSSGFEVQGWFKVTAAEKPAVNNFLTLTSKEATANSANRNWWISMRSDGRIWWKSSPGIDTTNATDMANGAWHHFAAVHDGGVARLYLDGVQVAADVTPGVADTQTAPVLFGNEDGTARYHKGLLEELRLSNVARSSNWVWAVYQNILSNGAFTSISAVSGVVTNPPAAPNFESFAVTSGQPSFSIGGTPGYNYTVQGSTNLVTWNDLLTTNPVAMPFQWTDYSATNFQRRFYRTLVSP
jgi:hypothetical protein